MFRITAFVLVGLLSTAACTGSDMSSGIDDSADVGGSDCKLSAESMLMVALNHKDEIILPRTEDSESFLDDKFPGVDQVTLGAIMGKLYFTEHVVGLQQSLRVSATRNEDGTIDLSIVVGSVDEAVEEDGGESEFAEILIIHLKDDGKGGVVLDNANAEILFAG